MLCPLLAPLALRGKALKPRDSRLHHLETIVPSTLSAQGTEPKGSAPSPTLCTSVIVEGEAIVSRQQRGPPPAQPCLKFRKSFLPHIQVGSAHQVMLQWAVRMTASHLRGNRPDPDPHVPILTVRSEGKDPPKVKAFGLRKGKGCSFTSGGNFLIWVWAFSGAGHISDSVSQGHGGAGNLCSEGRRAGLTRFWRHSRCVLIACHQP